MDKNKIKNGLKDIEAFVRMMQDKAPKLRNQLSSIGWIVKSIQEEIDKPDEIVVPEIKIGGEVKL